LNIFSDTIAKAIASRLEQEKEFFMEKSLTDNQTTEAPVYFLDLTVENVRCFGERQTLDLSDGNGKPARWTVLLGNNGTGKTTLLQCLVGLEPNPIFSSSETMPRCLPKGGCWETLSVFNRYSDQDFLVKASKFGNNLLDSGLKKAVEGYEFRVHELGKGVTLLPFNQIKKLIIYAYGAGQSMGSGSLEKSYNPDNAAGLFSEDVSLINAVEWLLQAIFALQNSEPENKPYFENRYEKVKNMLIDLLPDVENLRAKPITINQSNPSIEFKTPYGWVDLRDLSLGYQTLIAWMVDLAHRLFKRYPDSDNPLEQPAIVLVDEIDLHLHPKWQRTVINHLTGIFKQTQFIVTAHSPLIVQSAPFDANIVLLKREGDQVIIHNDFNVIKGWRIDQVLTSDLFDLPTARPPEYDNYLKRQQEILSKPQITSADEQELKDIGKKLDELPIVTQHTDDNEAMKLIRETAELLKQVNL
jgi:energy-coupling factor transporter ATP-binding protein EcfA2